MRVCGDFAGSRSRQLLLTQPRPRKGPVQPSRCCVRCSSAWVLWPHAWHTNAAWVTRLSAPVCPQASQRSKVCLGSTSNKLRPACSALARSIENELSPASVSNASIQASFRRCAAAQELAGIRVGDGFGAAQQVGDREVLDRDEVVRSDEGAGGLVVEVAALVGDLAMPRSHCLARCPPVVRAALLFCEPLLGRRQPGRRRSCPTGIGQPVAVGGGGEIRDADVNSDLAPGGGQRRKRHIIARQDQHPVSALPANLDGLDPAYHRSVYGRLHPADAL